MVWSMSSNYSTDCYFCMLSPYSKWYVHEKKSTLYPNIPSAILHVPHGDGLPVPEPPDNFATYSEDEESVTSNSSHQL